MAYTPINWQTGDTITAEKLNRCDNGWLVESSSTTLCSESVTTAVGEMGLPEAVLSYSTAITADSIIVTLNGTDYTCQKQEMEGDYFYGGFDTAEGAPDFSTYPFFLWSASGTNTLYTETAGTYNITAGVSSETVEVSDDFAKARGYSVKTSIVPQESITTVASSMGYSAVLSYAAPISSNSIIVTFDGVDYTLQKNVVEGMTIYGEYGGNGFDFDVVPFGIIVVNGSNNIFTESASTHTIKIVLVDIEVSNDLQSAINTVNTSALRVLTRKTTWKEARDAFLDGKNVWLMTTSGGTTKRFVASGYTKYTMEFVSNYNGSSTTTTLSANSANDVLQSV